MPIPLRRVHEIRDLLDAAGDEWRSRAAKLPEIRTVSEPGLTPEIAWLDDRVSHATGDQHSLLYRDYLSGRWYSTGSVDSDPPTPGQASGALPRWSRRSGPTAPDQSSPHSR